MLKCRLQDSRTRTSLDIKFLLLFSHILKKQTPQKDSFYFFEMVIFYLNKAEPSPDCKVIKVLTFDHWDIFAKKHSRMMTAFTFSHQNAGIHVSNT